MKDCKECGGSGATAGLYSDHVTGSYPYAKLCPCLTDRLAKLEKVAEAAKDFFNPDLEDMLDENCERLREALAALEDTR